MFNKNLVFSFDILDFYNEIVFLSKNQISTMIFFELTYQSISKKRQITRVKLKNSLDKLEFVKSNTAINNHLNKLLAIGLITYSKLIGYKTFYYQLDIKGVILAYRLFYETNSKYNDLEFIDNPMLLINYALFESNCMLDIINSDEFKIPLRLFDNKNNYVILPNHKQAFLNLDDLKYYQYAHNIGKKKKEIKDLYDSIGKNENEYF